MNNNEQQDPECFLRLARAGAGPALGQLLELYRNYLSLLARLQIGRRLQGKVDASDLVQETFLRAHRDFAQFRGNSEEEFWSWMNPHGCWIRVWWRPRAHRVNRPPAGNRLFFSPTPWAAYRRTTARSSSCGSWRGSVS